jgi:hypothetical protein
MNTLKSLLLLSFVLILGLINFPGCTESPKEPSPVSAKESAFSLTNFSQEITTSSKLSTLNISEKITIPVTIKNPGSEIWPAKGQKLVALSYAWLDSNRKELSEGNRSYLTKNIAPGESATQQLEIIGFTKPGEYILQISMVQENVAWFMHKGGKSLEMKISIK